MPGVRMNLHRRVLSGLAEQRAKDARCASKELKRRGGRCRPLLWLIYKRGGATTFWLRNSLPRHWYGDEFRLSAVPFNALGEDEAHALLAGHGGGRRTELVESQHGAWVARGRLVRDGEARLIRRREPVEDLLRFEC